MYSVPQKSLCKEFDTSVLLPDRQRSHITLTMNRSWSKLKVICGRSLSGNPTKITYSLQSDF